MALGILDQVPPVARCYDKVHSLKCVTAFKIRMLFSIACKYFVLCVQEEVRVRFPEFLQEMRKTVRVMLWP